MLTDALAHWGEIIMASCCRHVLAFLTRALLLGASSGLASSSPDQPHQGDGPTRRCHQQAGLPGPRAAKGRQVRQGDLPGHSLRSCSGPHTAGTLNPKPCSWNPESSHLPSLNQITVTCFQVASWYAAACA